MADDSSAVKNKGSSGKRIALITAGTAIVGAFVGLYGIFHQPSTEIPDYQRQVLATCTRVHDIVARDHAGDFVTIGPQGATIRKAALIQVMNNDLASAKTEFALLNQRKTPGSLDQPKREAEQAEQVWYRVRQADIQFVQNTVRDGESLTELNSQSSARGLAESQANARLNAAMTALAGVGCTSTF